MRWQVPHPPSRWTRQARFAPLRRPLHRRLLARLLRLAEIVGGIDQRDMGQGLREVSGLTAYDWIEFLRKESKIVGHCDDALEHRPRLGEVAGQHIGIGEPKGAWEKSAFDRVP